MSSNPSTRNDPRPTELKLTEFIDEAVSATCSRCAATEFERGTMRKALADRLRDVLLWRAVAGRLVCLACIMQELEASVRGGEVVRFTYDGCGYRAERIGSPHRNTYYIEAKRTDGGGGRLIPLDGRALDAVLVRWRP